MMINLISRIVIETMERGWLADSWKRTLSRSLCRHRLSQLRRVNAEADDSGIVAFADAMRQGPIAPVPEKANEQHYELPAEFFQWMLGPRLKYSCCYFENPQSTLEEAEIASLRLTCEHAELEDGMQVLELGCGWGSLTLWMLEHYPNLQVTAVSNSHQQREFIQSRAKALGVSDRLGVLTADMNDLELDQTFDRVVSCEMFEHMRNYEQLLQRIAHWLSPSGKLFVHLFCHRQYAYEFQSTGAANWMGRYFFTGGIMPSARLIDQFSSQLVVSRRWTWSGVHYERTCNAWLQRLDRHRNQVMDLLHETYGQQQAGRWFQRWRLFLIAGAELFGYQQGQQWQVSHYLLDKVTTLEASGVAS